ncbi:Cdp-diacylglycerol-glycerol-3-phosphate 3-phosphatidyltransferase [Globisporangium polare]
MASRPAPALGYDALFRSIARQSRVFPLKSERVTLLPSPSAFYEQLLANVRAATTRITISSLYLGTGTLERALVDEIALKLRANPDVQVKIVLDYSRGQRGGQSHSSVSMLKRLLAEFPGNVELYLYKVPQLRGVKAALPPPFNETMGVSHAKVYLVDDTLVLSGANLSEDYFTNRQDRYVQMADCGGLAQFYHQFVGIVAAHSFRVQLVQSITSSADSGSIVNGEALTYELLGGASHDSDAGKAAMKQAFEDLVAVKSHPQDAVSSELVESNEGDAWAFPTIQFTPVDVTHDEVVLSEFIEQLPSNSSLRIASGYLNFPPFLDDLLVRCGAHLDVLLAAPIANGFFNASGIKGALPMAYSLIEQEFYEKTRTGRGTNLTTVLREFNRAHWTFHGKGMWWSPSLESPPQLTIFGSSNFGRRSYGCDLESQVVLFTKSPALQSKLKDEYDALAANAEVVTDQVWKRPDRVLSGVFSWKYGHWIRPVTKIISAYL